MGVQYDLFEGCIAGTADMGACMCCNTEESITGCTLRLPTLAAPVCSLRLAPHQTMWLQMSTRRTMTLRVHQLDNRY
jgi:hypothetical protein